MGPFKLWHILVAAGVLLATSLNSWAGICDSAWDGDRIGAALSSRPSYLQIPLRTKEQHKIEVTAGQIQAFYDAKKRIARVVGFSPKFIICSGAPNAFATKTRDLPRDFRTSCYLRMAPVLVES